MKTFKQFIAGAFIAFLGACGGGGGSNDTGTGGTSNQNPQQNVSTVTNPVTGTAAPGRPTTTVKGTAPAGATVTAYSIQPDGTSGAALGASATADVNGEFTLTLNTEPTGMVRLVATGGTITRDVDNTVQPNTTMELVTPYVTTVGNNFVISPLTDIAAHVMAFKAKNGDTLASAFVTGMRTLLTLDSATFSMRNDFSVFMNILRGSVKSDSTYYGAQSNDARELRTALELFGVMYDLPAKDVMRVVAATAENNYPLSAVDGAGNAINAGAWVGSTFDPSAPMTLKALMNAKTPADLKVLDPETNTQVAPDVATFIDTYLIKDVVLDAACRGGAVTFLTTRYPFYPLDNAGKIPAADCLAANQRLAEVLGRVQTNNSTGMR